MGPLVMEDGACEASPGGGGPLKDGGVLGEGCILLEGTGAAARGG